MPPKSAPPSLAKRVVFVIVGLAAAAFAVQGGEWGTIDLLSQRRRIARLEVDIDSLQHTVDSLKAYRKRLATDPVLQERIAREEFGDRKSTRLNSSH